MSIAMSGPMPVLLMLLALLVSPGSPRRRLMTRRRAPRRAALVGVAWAAGATGCLAGILLVPVASVLAAATACGTAAVGYRRRLRARRGAEEGAALESALDVLVGELRVGAHPVRAFGTAADETRGPVSTALRGVAARARLGADVAAGLRDSARSSALPSHWERLAVCWELASQHGLAIATVMRAAQRDIAERQRFSAQVQAKMAGARATAAILAGLPALGVALGELIGARPLRFLLLGHAGGWLLVIGVMLACGGLLWSDRITDRALA